MKALLIIDVQNDFLPGGSLAVPTADAIVPLINQLQKSDDYHRIVASQDWHPADHGSFAQNHPGKAPGDQIDLHGLPQILWPTHCVQNTPGADFSPALDRNRWHHVTQKGTDPTIDSYSAFFDNGHRKATDLADYLRDQNVTHLDLVGVATDYCVKFTALDAHQLGFQTTVLTPACRAVNLTPTDETTALADLKTQGITIST